MELKSFGELLAILTILEPDSKTCQAVIRLAQAGTATEGETDTSILLEIKNSLKSDIEKELEEVNSKKLEIKQNLIAKFLE